MRPFLVRVSNPFGTTASATATITMGEVPHITSEPLSQTICPGTVRVLSLAATGPCAVDLSVYAGITR